MAHAASSQLRQSVSSESCNFLTSRTPPSAYNREKSTANLPGRTASDDSSDVRGGIVTGLTARTLLLMPSCTSQVVARRPLAGSKAYPSGLVVLAPAWLLRQRSAAIRQAVKVARRDRPHSDRGRDLGSSLNRRDGILRRHVVGFDAGDWRSCNYNRLARSTSSYARRWPGSMLLVGCKIAHDLGCCRRLPLSGPTRPSECFASQ
jgi:hypothetical protein